MVMSVVLKILLKKGFLDHNWLYNIRKTNFHQDNFLLDHLLLSPTIRNEEYRL